MMVWSWVLLATLMMNTSQGYVERFRPTIDLGEYTLEHMHPVIGSYFMGNVSSDVLTCFGNNDVEECSYMHTFICMIPGMRSMAQNLLRCDSLWGSRSVVVEVQGSVEFLRVNKLPEESNAIRRTHPSSLPIPSLDTVTSTMLTATRWLEIQAVGRTYEWKKEIKHIPSEPFYLCARSNHWQGGESSMRIEFRPSYFRDNDYNWVIKKTLVHITLVVAVSSMWLLPYIASMVTSVMVFIHGFDYYLACLIFSGSVVCLTPLMFTNRNRHLAKLYLRYFFARKQAREVRQLMRERRPLFQALYFSCATMSVGSLAGFCIYSYLGIDREFRNTIYKLTLAASSAWLTFFLCRSFEKFFRRWSWVPMTYALTLLLELHMNPMSKEEAVVAVIFITFCVEWLLVPQVNLNTRIGRDLRGVHWLENGVMRGMWTSSVTIPSTVSGSDLAGVTSIAHGSNILTRAQSRDKITRDGRRRRSKDRDVDRDGTNGAQDGNIYIVDDTSGDWLSSSDMDASRSSVRIPHHLGESSASTHGTDDEDNVDGKGDQDEGDRLKEVDDSDGSAHIDAFNVETPPRPSSSMNSSQSLEGRDHSGSLTRRTHTIVSANPKESSTPSLQKHSLVTVSQTPPGAIGNTYNITINVSLSPAAHRAEHGESPERLSLSEDDRLHLMSSVEKAVKKVLCETPSEA